MIIEFDTYYISPIQVKDSWKICDLIIANQDRLKYYFPKTLEENLTPTLSELFTNKKVKQFNNNEELLFTLKEKETNVLVGLIYIKELNWTKKQGEFAYCIGYTHEKKGLISKSVTALTNHCFENLGLQTLQIITHKTNIGSVKVAEKCNFKWKKTLKNEFTPIGEQPLDMELYEVNF